MSTTYDKKTAFYHRDQSDVAVPGKPATSCALASPDAPALNPATGAGPAPVALPSEPCGPAGLIPSRAALALLDALDPAACRYRVLNALHAHPACPACGAPYAGMLRFYDDARCRCRGCGQWFTARTGTVLNGSHLDYRQIFLLCALAGLMERGLTPALIAEAVGVSTDTVRLWIKKLKAFEVDI